MNLKDGKWKAAFKSKCIHSKTAVLSKHRQACSITELVCLLVRGFFLSCKKGIAGIAANKRTNCKLQQYSTLLFVWRLPITTKKRFSQKRAITEDRNSLVDALMRLGNAVLDHVSRLKKICQHASVCCTAISSCVCAQWEAVLVIW